MPPDERHRARGDSTIRLHPSISASLKWLSRHAKGHVFLFDTKPSPAYDSSAGLRLLLLFLVLEYALGPRLALFSFLRLPQPSTWLRVPILLGLALIAIRFFARVKLPQIGLRAWRLRIARGRAGEKWPGLLQLPGQLRTAAAGNGELGLGLL